MVKKSLEFLQKDKTLWIALLIFFAGIFLRFYRFGEFVTFLGDQGRDATVLRRILTLEHFPAIGAPTSVGQVYLGPFYYYFIAPWLLLFNFNPIGPAVGVATLSSLLILFNYFLVKQLFDKSVALISSVLIAFSSVLVGFSRFSWNPNLLPLFVLFTIYVTIVSVKTQKTFFYILTGVFLSFAIQLHYLALFLVFPIAVIFLWNLFENKKDLRQIAKRIGISVVSFGIFSSPLLVFDLRHNFLNSQNFIKLFQSTSSSQAQNKLAELLQTFYYLNQYVFNTELNITLLAFLFFIFIVLFFLHIKTNRILSYLLLFFFFSSIGLSLYSGPKHPHYFGSVISTYLILISYLLANLLKSRIAIPALVLFIALYIFFNAKGYYYFRTRGSNQIEKAQKIAEVIKGSITKPQFAVTALPHQYSDSTYRYFLEIWGKRPLEKDTLEPAQELFVICEGSCKPIGDPQWDIAYFKPKKVEEIKVIFPAVTMYRLSN